MKKCCLSAVTHALRLHPTLFKEPAELVEHEPGDIEDRPRRKTAQRDPAQVLQFAVAAEAAAKVRGIDGKKARVIPPAGIGGRDGAAEEPQRLRVRYALSCAPVFPEAHTACTHLPGAPEAQPGFLGTFTDRRVRQRAAVTGGTAAQLS